MKKMVIIWAVLSALVAFTGCSKSKVEINSVADLAGKKIGVQAGTTGEAWVQENVADANIASFKTGMDAALDLKNRAIDAVILDELPANVAAEGSKVVKLGTNAAFPPFEYVEGKNIVGFDITMGQIIAKNAGLKLEVVDMAFDSLIPALQSGTIDFIAAGMSVNEERKKNVDFSETYFESEQVIIVRK